MRIPIASIRSAIASRSSSLIWFFSSQSALWDIDGEEPHIPSDDELNSMLENVGYGKVTLDGNKVTMPEGVTLDLGAAGKGIGCDAAQKILDADKNVSGMILNLGGSSVMSYGNDWLLS